MVPLPIMRSDAEPVPKAGRSTDEFAAVGRFARGLSSVLGGAVLGLSVGMIGGIGRAMFGAAVFVFAERIGPK